MAGIRLQTSHKGTWRRLNLRAFSSTEAETGQMVDDISFLLCKMCRSKGKLPLGVRLIMLPALREILSCSPITASGDLIE